MSGFDKDWLALREPVDRVSRNMALVFEMVEHLDPVARPRIMDIGCGTGSTWRALSSFLPCDTRWMLVDYDPVLLREAERIIGEVGSVEFRQHDLTDLDSLPLEGVSLVSASALFDLCSSAFCAQFVERLADVSCGLYAALNYDGITRWSVTHPLDAIALKSFNDHQRTDKGFGVALGPDATALLAQYFGARGYSVRIASSPWRMKAREADLQRVFLEGFRQPLEEIGYMTATQIDEWLAFRLSAIERKGSLCEVTHADLLALPG